MSNQLYKASRAFIQNNSATRPIRLVGYANPEVVFPPLIRNFFSEVGYMKMYPYFNTLRIGSIHPFALLLYQDVSNQKMDTSLFPSITIADTTDAENDDTLSRQHEEVMFDGSGVELLRSAVEAGDILTSDENMIALKNATAHGEKIYGLKHTYRANHSVDMNIWADNKDMVSLIYDMLKHFIVSNIDTLHELGIDINNAISGRRSGDINVDFGKLLYGANITVPAVIQTTSMTVELPVKDIKEIQVDVNAINSHTHILGGE